MRRLLYIIVLAALLAVPVHPTDVGNMLPVELVMVYAKGSGVEIRTDTGNRGVGRSLQEAAADLKESASEELFLDTADYLILSGNGVPPDQLKGIFKDRIYVCRGSRDIDLSKAARYLSEHTPKHRLKDMEWGIMLSEIRKTDNGFTLS